MKSTVRALMLLSLFLLARAANAAVLISEVQIAPTESRFIELYNNGSEAVDLTGYYIQRKTETGSSFSSLVTSTNFNGKQIGAGKFFVISRANVTNTDIMVANMTLTESNTIQLKNSSGEVVDKLCWGNAGDCDGAKLAANPADGKSISLVGTEFMESTPTLGALNTTTDNTNNNLESNVATSTESPNTDTSVNTPSGGTSQPSIKLIYPEPVFVNTPVMFNISSFGSIGDKHIYGKYVWNFGDGVSLESRASDPNDLPHTYFYPGDYVLTLEYYAGDYAISPSLTFRKNISVLPVSVTISKIGDQKDFFVELYNQTKSEINISGWKMVHGNEVFVFPKNTFLLAGKKVIFSSAITNFHFNNIDSVILYNNSSDLVFDSVSLNPKKVSSIANTISYVNKNTTQVKNKSNQGVIDLTESNSMLNNVNSNYMLAQTPEGGLGQSATLPLLILLLCGGGGVVYWIRRGYKNKSISRDFEILDE